MSDSKAILARLRVLIEARKAAVRIRIIDRAFARIAATGLCLLLLAGTASARTVAVRYNGRLVVINNPVIVQAQPRVKPTDHWDAARASYFQHRYGGPIFSPIR